jgi:hypothetical protein
MTSSAKDDTVNDPLIAINDIFKEHDLACPITFMVRTRNLPVSRRDMIVNQIRHNIPDHRVSLFSDRILIEPPDRVGS